MKTPSLPPGRSSQRRPGLPHLDPRLDLRLDPRLDPRSDPRLDLRLDPRLDRRPGSRLDLRLDPRLGSRLGSRLDPRLGSLSPGLGRRIERVARWWAAVALIAALGTGCDDPEGAPGGGDPADVGASDAEIDSGDPSDAPDPEDESPDGDSPDGDLIDAAPACAPLDCEDFLNDCDGLNCPALSDYEQVVPSAALPEGVETQNANNNLDAIEHGGRVFLAFRTAPYHFADKRAELFVVSTPDHVNYRFEGRFSMQTDLREMRLFNLGEKLFMVFAVLGDNPIDFEPQGMMVTEYEGPGQWTTPEYFYGEGFIPWRTKTIGGRVYLIAYEGGENIYDIDGEPIRVHWLTTEDGRQWVPVVPDQPVVLEGGSSETDFVLMDDGALVAVSRNEAGDDELGWGSKVCRAEPESLGDWRCVADRRKYDSPLLFRHGDGVWLLARRNVTDTGHYDLGEGDTPQARTRRNLLAYSNAPKRCALWRVDPTTLEVAFVLDLPSRGDTCFPAIVPQDNGDILVYNYTSPIEAAEMSWLRGQGGPTLIYRLRLTLP